MRVVASDGLWADTATVTIRVTDVPVPGKPAAPAVAGGSSGIHVTWSPPEHDAAGITTYWMRYRLKDSGRNWRELRLTSPRFQAHLSTEEDGTYEVQIQAWNVEGPSEWSESGEARTNRAPAFAADALERSVAENAAGGTAAGDPVTAEDADGDTVSYRVVGGSGGGLFEIGAQTGRITVAGGAVLDYEGGDTVQTVLVEASDGMAADTATVAIRITNADDPGMITLNANVARVGMRLTATLMDEDGSQEAGKTRQWRISQDGGATWTDIAGATTRFYTPVASDEGKLLRAVFTYADGHGPGKRAESQGVRVTGMNQAPAFSRDTFERTVAENAPATTPAGEPVTAADGNGDLLAYALVAGSEDAPFAIHAETGQITVAAEAVLDYESGDTIYTVRVEASDRMLADTASVTIRVADADDPGVVTLDAAVARVDIAITAALEDQDGPVEEGLARQWQRLVGGGTVWSDIEGATAASYTPLNKDIGLQLRAVFTYTDGHGPGKRAESRALPVTYHNVAPAFPSDTVERTVPENSEAGAPVGAPVTATDINEDKLAYAFVPGADEALFAIVASSGQIEVAPGAALDYESGDTIYTVRVEASDGMLADTAVVTIRVADADDPGIVALDASVGRVGVRIAASLMDQDGSRNQGKKRKWQLSDDGGASWANIPGATTRFYNPVAGDEGKLLRAVFTYTDGHGPGKRADSPAVPVVGATTPAVSFGAAGYTVSADGSVDVTVRLSPAATSALDIEVTLGGSAEAATHTVAFETGYGERTLPVGAAGLSAHDTIEVAFGTLPAGVVAGVPAEATVVVTETAGDAADPGEDLIPLAVEFAETAYTAHAGSAGTEVSVRVSPAADREVAVPVTATGAGGHAVRLEDYGIPASLLFEPGDSLRVFTVQAPPAAPPGALALGFGTLPEAVSEGANASATLDIVDTGASQALLDESFDVGLAVFGRAVAEGARQAVGGRFDAVMRPGAQHTPGSGPGSAGNWTARATSILGSLTGAPLNGGGSAGREVRLRPAVQRLGPGLRPGVPRQTRRRGLRRRPARAHHRRRRPHRRLRAPRPVRHALGRRLQLLPPVDQGIPRPHHEHRDPLPLPPALAQDRSLDHGRLRQRQRRGPDEPAHPRNLPPHGLRRPQDPARPPRTVRTRAQQRRPRRPHANPRRRPPGRRHPRTRTPRGLLRRRRPQTRHPRRRPLRRRRRRRRRRNRNRRLDRLRRQRPRPRPQRQTRHRRRRPPGMGRRPPPRLGSRVQRRRPPARPQPQPRPPQQRPPRTPRQRPPPIRAPRRLQSPGLAPRRRSRLRHPPTRQPLARRLLPPLHTLHRPLLDPRDPLRHRPLPPTQTRSTPQPQPPRHSPQPDQTRYRYLVLTRSGHPAPRRAPRTSAATP